MIRYNLKDELYRLTGIEYPDDGNIRNIAIDLLNQETNGSMDLSFSDRMSLNAALRTHVPKGIKIVAV